MVMGKTIQRDLMLCQPWLNNFMLSDADLLSGEQFSKYKKAAHQNNPSMKTLGLLPDMLLFARSMVLFLLWSQKFSLMDLTPLKIAKKLQKRFYQLFSTHSKKIMFSWKDAS